MIYTIKGEQPIQILTDAFSIGPSSEGYVLQISSNGYDYSDLFSVGPNITRMVTGVASGSYYRLKGNASEVDINWIKNCGGGSGSGPQGAQGPQGPAGGGEGGDSHVLLSSSAIPQNLQSGDVFAKADGVYQTKIEKTDKVSYLLSLTEMKSQEDGEVWFATSNDGEICTFMQQNSVWGFYDRGAGVFYPESAFSDWAPKDGISNSNLQFIINGDDVYAVSDASEILIYISGAKPYVGTITQGMGAKVYKIVGGSEYSLPIASETQLGGVKIGSGITIDAEGRISAQGSGTADMDILNPVSALPSNSWTTWADNTFTAARETCTNDGDYLIHWNDGQNYTGARIANGAITDMPYGGSWQLGADGKYRSSEWAGFTCWTESGKLYWMGVPSVISMLDAYDTGSDKEGYVINIDANGSVRATSGGTYQVLNNNWVPLVRSESGVVNIWKGTIAEYNALGTYDNNTFYIIL